MLTKAERRARISAGIARAKKPPVDDALTPAELAAVVAVITYVEVFLRPVTVDEIAERLGLATTKGSFRARLARLAEQGWILKLKGAPNGPGHPRVFYAQTKKGRDLCYDNEQAFRAAAA